MSPSIESQAPASEISSQNTGHQAESGKIMRFFRIKIMHVMGGLALLFIQGCATLSPKPDPFTDEATMSVNMARELGGTIGVNGNRTVIINCLRGSSPVESTNKLDDLNGSVLPGAKKADVATGELGKQDYLTCVKSVVEAAPSAPPPEKPEQVYEMKQKILKEKLIWIKFHLSLINWSEKLYKENKKTQKSWQANRKIYLWLTKKLSERLSLYKKIKSSSESSQLDFEGKTIDEKARETATQIFKEALENSKSPGYPLTDAELQKTETDMGKIIEDMERVFNRYRRLLK